MKLLRLIHHYKNIRYKLLSLLLIVVLIISTLYLRGGKAQAQTTFLTDTSATSWAVPADWNNSNNSIEVIGGGGGGGGGTANQAGSGAGGGGGAYSKATNVTLTPGSTVTIAVGTAGTGGGGSGIAGSSGGDTYVCNSSSNCASIAGTAVIAGASGGGGGATSGGAGGSGGSATNGVGSVTNSGGGGGNAGTNNGQTGAGGGGGGGAAGAAGAGIAGTTPASNTAGSGGAGDNSSGGAGGTTSGISGSSGTEWDSSHGSGGGGAGGDGGARSTAGSIAGAGGAYGAGGGGGGAGGKSSSLGGNGSGGNQGLIVITYTPIPITFTQSSYQWFDNADSPAPGATLTVSQNQAATLSLTGQSFRLRQLLSSNLSISAGAQTFNEQYAALGAFGSCSAITSGNWSNVSGGAQSTNLFPSSGTVTATGGSNWTNPGNIIANDGAQATSTTSDTTNLLVASSFGFSVPANATVSGIQVNVSKTSNDPSSTLDSTARIQKGGASIGTDEKSAINWPASLGVTTYGSPTDLWGTTWLPSDINSSGFGFGIAATDPLGAIVGVDYISITVYYSLPNSVITYYDNSTMSSGDGFSPTGSDPTDTGQTVTQQTYQESDGFTNTSTYGGTVDGEWDLSLYDNGAPAGTTYCFRTVKSDGTPLDTYSQYPMITTHTNQPPAAPTLLGPNPGETGVSTTPQFTLRTTDAESDYLKYRIYLYLSDCATPADASSPFTQSSNPTGWSNMDADGNTAYSSSPTLSVSRIATYDLQFTLAKSTTYCWKADATDPAGTNTYSSPSATQLFTTSATNDRPVNINGNVNIKGNVNIR